MRKKLLPIILFLLILVTLTSCRGDSYSFKEPIDEIESIEIVSAESSLEFTVLKTLLEERGAFIEQFQAIEFHKCLGDQTDLYGDAIKITYQSGIYEMICPFGAEYIENGTIQYRWRRCDEDEFNKLLNNFLK